MYMYYIQCDDTTCINNIWIIAKPPDIVRLYGGGWLAVLEEREEWACLTHYVLTAWQPSFQRFAISLRAPFTMPGIYHWLYPNGSLGRDTK